MRKFGSFLACFAPTIIALSPTVDGFQVQTNFPARLGTAVPSLRYRHQDTILNGLLDDMLGDSTESVNESEISTAPSNEKFDSLFNSLVFTTADVKTVIEKKLDACVDPGFLKYVEDLLQGSDDAEEKQAYRDLLEAISTVQETVAEAQKLAEEASAAESKADVEPMEETQTEDSTTENLSAADVLRRANDIDRAAISAAASDDEKPSDFISDCREVVNLSRGFNDRGQMRVGGR